MSTIIKNIHSHVLSALIAITLIAAGCEQTVPETPALPGSDSNTNEKIVNLSIKVGQIPQYNDQRNENDNEMSAVPAVSDRVRPALPNLTPASDESVILSESGELINPQLIVTEDTQINRSATRSILPSGRKFRLIVFKKTGGGYVYQTAADYTSSGASSPILSKGSMRLPVNNTFRIVAYTFNTNEDMGPFLSTYTWQSTSIPIPNMSRDFLTCVLSDLTPSEDRLNVVLNFTHQLAEVLVSINATNFQSTIPDRCEGLTINPAGDQSGWIIGQPDIVQKNNSSQPVSFSNGREVTVRVIPYANSSKITAHIDRLVISGINIQNITIQSTLGVKILKGRRYRFQINITDGTPGIVVPADKITQGDAQCTETDKRYLSSLRWSTSDMYGEPGSSAYNWADKAGREYGTLYEFNYLFGRGNPPGGGTDPCSLLPPAVYGTGWRMPNQTTVESLKRCNDARTPTWARFELLTRDGSGPMLDAPGYKAGPVAQIQQRNDVGYFWSSALRAPTGSSPSNYWDVILITTWNNSNRRVSIGWYTNKRWIYQSVRCIKGQQ